MAGLDDAAIPAICMITSGAASRQANVKRCQVEGTLQAPIEKCLDISQNADRRTLGRYKGIQNA
ncbi:hypothetical protein FA13DRAFT_1726475 [Coprinellus micaceus]|jgi:hypothetical protein|uniref:Uncharacterized protein n=1 Tax=Coprinellus micaceus TaxID=71717 RepID=A0A4Y7TTU1_COPMI|nr:hypothetical protein FA13DRAFT_1726475 [Coprinellus micaceus]